MLGLLLLVVVVRFWSWCWLRHLSFIISEDASTPSLSLNVPLLVESSLVLSLEECLPRRILILQTGLLCQLTLVSERLSFTVALCDQLLLLAEVFFLFLLVLFFPFLELEIGDFAVLLSHAIFDCEGLTAILLSQLVAPLDALQLFGRTLGWPVCLTRSLGLDTTV